MKKQTDDLPWHHCDATKNCSFNT